MSQQKTPKVSGFVGSFSPAVAPVNEASLVGAVSRRVAHAHIVVVLVVPVRLVRVHLLEQGERQGAHANENEEKNDLLHCSPILARWASGLASQKPFGGILCAPWDVGSA